MAAHYVRAALRSSRTDTGALCVNVLHYEVDVFSEPPNWASVAADIWTRIGSAYLGVLTASEQMHELTVTVENYVGAVPGQGVSTIEQAGGRAGGDAKLDNAQCLLVALRTATPKRYARGHMFCPPASDSAQLVAGGLWSTTGTYYTAIANFANLAFVGWSAASTTYIPIVFSRTRAISNASPYIFPVTAHELKRPVHYLRSRNTSP